MFKYKGKIIDRLPAVLIGGLTLIRPLGMAGIPVIVIEERVSTNIRKESKSRYVIDCYSIEDRKKTENQSLCQNLLSIGEKLFEIFGTPLPLFYGTDYELKMVYENNASLSKYFLFVVNDKEIGLALMDKTKFYNLCIENDIQTPKAFYIDAHASENSMILADIKFPVILKPIFKTNWLRDKRHEILFGKVRKALTISKIEELKSTLSNPLYQSLLNNIVIQEYIPGNESEIYSFHGFSDEEAKILACFTGRKIRTYPFEMGESSYIEMIDDPQLLELGKAIVSRLGIKGPYKIDFKKDPNNNIYYVLEINARYNLWHYLGAKNGINLPSVAYDYMVMNNFNSVHKISYDYKWINFKFEYLVFNELRRKNKITFLDWGRSLYPRKKIYSVFAWDDPWPFFYMFFEKLKRKCRS